MSSSAAANKSVAAQANALWQKQPKANAELFALTYGALLSELMRDLEAPDKIHEALDSMGHSVGIRCVEELLAKSEQPIAFRTFSQSALVVKTALRMFLGIVAETSSSASGASETSTNTSYSVTFTDNPLTLFVELPESLQDSHLEYSQFLCGMIRGMLEMLSLDVKVEMEQSILKGDDKYQMVVELQQVLQDGAGEEYQEE